RLSIDGPVQSTSALNVRCPPRSGAVNRTAVMPVAAAPDSSRLPPSPTYRHSWGSTPSRAHAARYMAGCGLQCPMWTEYTQVSRSGATGRYGRNAGSSYQQSLTSPVRSPRLCNSASTEAASGRRTVSARTASIRATTAASRVASSGSLIVYAAAPALAIAFWRNALAVGVLAPVTGTGRRRELLSLTSGDGRRTGAWSVLAGLALAVHFGTWVPSAKLTSIAAATALVCTSPVWTALIASLRGARIP